MAKRRAARIYVGPSLALDGMPMKSNTLITSKRKTVKQKDTSILWADVSKTYAAYPKRKYEQKN